MPQPFCDRFKEYEDAYGPGFEDMRRRVPNVDKLASLTGYAPETPLEETVRQIADWMIGARAQ